LLPAPELTLPVTSVRRATTTTRIVRLNLGSSNFRFQAGQAAIIGLADRPERVPYSIACAPEEAARDRFLEFLIKVESSGRWGHMFDRIARGQSLGVRGPYGSFVFPARSPEERFLFIAGGTGIAPIRAMIRHAILARMPGRMKLLFSARTPSDFAYLPDLRGMARRRELDMRLHVTREAGTRWRGERGRIALAHLSPLVEAPATLCFVCGPASMVADVPLMLTKLGVPRANVKVEEW
jgi:ferredoxin-NADP reductase